MSAPGKPDILPRVEHQRLPIVIAAQKGEVRPVGQAQIRPFYRVDGVAPVIKKEMCRNATYTFAYGTFKIANNTTVE